MREEGAEQAIERRVLSTFADVAASLGYSSLHGKIIGVLLVHSKPLSLQELAAETGYSAGMLSLSLDLLEVLGVIRKMKKTSDRKLYVSLSGDLLECLKNAITIKIMKGIKNSIVQFEEDKKELEKLEGQEKVKVMKTISVLESELKRLEGYISLLSSVRLPK